VSLREAQKGVAPDGMVGRGGAREPDRDPAPIVRWSAVVMRLAATVAVVAGLAWLARGVGRASLAGVGQDPPAAMFPGAMLARAGRGMPAERVRPDEAPSGNRPGSTPAMMPVYAEDIEILSKLTKPKAPAPCSRKEPVLGLPPSAVRLYERYEGSEPGWRFYEAIYRMPAGTVSAEEILQTALQAAGWEPLGQAGLLERGARVLRFGRQGKQMILYVRAKPHADETIFIVHVQERGDAGGQ